ncbi:MAG: AtpZ/AtpI family protein [Bacteroidales bacterium]|nr:AtpZ/AtpI family protein [Bacteroidales bacterium]
MSENKDKERLRVIAKYTSAAFEMAAVIVLGALGGRWLDNEFLTSPVWTLVLTVVSVALGLYLFIKDIIKK